MIEIIECDARCLLLVTHKIIMWMCAICHESDQDSVGRTRCGHYFHQDCQQEELSSSDIDQEESNDEYSYYDSSDSGGEDTDEVTRIAEMAHELTLTEEPPPPPVLHVLLNRLELESIDFGSVNVLSGGQDTQNQCLPCSVTASLFHSLNRQGRIPLPSHAHFDQSSQLIFRQMVERVPEGMRLTHYNLQRNTPIDSDVLEHFVQEETYDQYAFEKLFED